MKSIPEAILQCFDKGLDGLLLFFPPSDGCVCAPTSILALSSMATQWPFLAQASSTVQTQCKELWNEVVDDKWLRAIEDVYILHACRILCIHPQHRIQPTTSSQRTLQMHTFSRNKEQTRHPSFGPEPEVQESKTKLEGERGGVYSTATSSIQT